jgi:hypothetical protein
MQEGSNMPTHVISRLLFLLIFVPLVSLAQSGTSGNDTTVLINDHLYDRTQHPLFHHVKVYFGGAFPSGDFGSPNSSSTTSGFAMNAFSGGIEYNIELLQGFGLMIGETFSFHNTNKEDWLDKYKNYNIDIQNWLLMWSTAGLFFDKDFSPSINVYIDGQAGVLHTNYPQISIIDPYNQSGIVTAPSIMKFGYKAGGGVRWERYELGIHFLSSDLNFDSYADFHSLSLNPHIKVQQYPKQVPVRVLMVTFGYILGG